MRIFTNVDATANALARADERVRAVAWNDPMAFGRLPGAASLAEYAAERAEAFAAVGWEEAAIAQADLLLRYEALESAFAENGEVALLFGGSLRDQLQLAQILFWLSSRPEPEWKRARAMVVDGPLSIFEDGALLEVAKEGAPVDFATLEAYRSAWLAVTASDPSHAAFAFRRLRNSRDQLTLAAALERWLEELPSWETGLSITEGQILDAVRLGIETPQELFEAVEETEAAPFRSNWEFWQELDRLSNGGDPLLRTRDGKAFLCPPRDLAWTEFHEQRLELTETGAAVLRGDRHASVLDRPERWLGGIRIHRDARWFWNYATATIEHSAKVGPVPFSS